MKKHLYELNSSCAKQCVYYFLVLRGFQKNNVPHLMECHLWVWGKHEVPYKWNTYGFPIRPAGRLVSLKPGIGYLKHIRWSWCTVYSVHYMLIFRICELLNINQRTIWKGKEEWRTLNDWNRCSLVGQLTPWSVTGCLEKLVKQA
jgi:hypothetical protein